MAYDAQHSVNVAECLALADFLEALPPRKFDLGFWSYHDEDCGTVACICGWLAERKGVDVYNPQRTLVGLPIGYLPFGAQELGISLKQARDLFTPFLLLNPTNKQAARVLRHLAATGEVDWSVALGDASRVAVELGEVA